MPTVIHLLLAVGLFLAINWIGQHSHSLGYISLSLFVRRDEAPAFNLALRLLGPVVFVTIASALLYVATLDSYVQDIWRVTLYYFLGRTGFNVAMGRSILINWIREIFVGSACISLTWLVYDHIIQHRKTLLPDFTTVTNELWVFIALFIYAVLNKVDTGTGGSERRKERYIRFQFERLNRRYGRIVDKQFSEELPHSICMAVLIFESFNRPEMARRLERLVFPFASKSLGPMQVTTTKPMSDEESVIRGSEIIADGYGRRLKEVELRSGDAYDAHWRRWQLVRLVAADYNRDESYVSGVENLHQVVVDLFYPNLKLPPMLHSIA